MILIGINGMPRSGKDTVADYLCCEYGFAKMSFAQPLKEAAAVLLGMTVDQMNGVNYDREAIIEGRDYSVRTFLQYLGTEGMRNFRASFWTDHIVQRIGVYQKHEELRGRMARIVIPDMRFSDERALVKYYYGTTLRVSRDSGYKSTGHVSDTPIECDVHLCNDGTLDELYAEVENFAHENGLCDA